VNGVIHDFAERLEFSAALSNEAEWIEFYQRVWPDMISAVRIDKDSKWQRSGVDRLVILPAMKQILIDEKKRSKGYDDFLMERWSSEHNQKIGWTLDPTKVCDYIAYAIPLLGKCYLLPFEILRATCESNLSFWETPQRKKPAQNRGYTTINYVVKWDELFTAMKQQMHRRFGGVEMALPDPRMVGDCPLFGWKELVAQAG
jgi:hypothetical protein